MKIFLDANVLVSVLNEEYPVYQYSSRILSLASGARFKVHTSPLALAIAFYFAEKKKKGTARQKINVLSERLEITAMHRETIMETCRNKRVHDFEDGLQYYSAVESGCKVIITEDREDFYFSDLEVMNSRGFMEKYLF
jgi:predicted nucleic acid-binding protein